MSIRPHLVEIDAILRSLQDAAIDCAGMDDDTTIAEARRGYATTAAGLARARHQLLFLTNLLEAPADADHRRPN